MKHSFRVDQLKGSEPQGKNIQSNTFTVEWNYGNTQAHHIYQKPKNAENIIEHKK